MDGGTYRIKIMAVFYFVMIFRRSSNFRSDWSERGGGWGGGGGGWGRGGEGVFDLPLWMNDANERTAVRV